MKQLTDREGLRRLSVGKWRVLFGPDTPDAAHIYGIDNRGSGLSAFSQITILSPNRCGAFR